MPLPYHIKKALLAKGEEPLEAECEAAKFHSPTPLLVYKRRVGERTAIICGTCEDNLTVYLKLLEANDGELPWEVRREFGNLLRALAQEEWDNNG